MTLLQERLMQPDSQSPDLQLQGFPKVPRAALTQTLPHGPHVLREGCDVAFLKHVEFARDEGIQKFRQPRLPPYREHLQFPDALIPRPV
ncbi:MAG TPA: hypothetical protein VJB16_02500, partial [archaeon]|nr:hypothetical protein [archaeon]